MKLNAVSKLGLNWKKNHWNTSSSIRWNGSKGGRAQIKNWKSFCFRFWCCVVNGILFSAFLNWMKCNNRSLVWCFFQSRYQRRKNTKGSKKNGTLQPNTRNKCIITAVLAFLISGYLQLTVLYFDNFLPFSVFAFLFHRFTGTSLDGWPWRSIFLFHFSIVVSLVKIISFFYSYYFSRWIIVLKTCISFNCVLYEIKMDECLGWSVHHFPNKEILLRV